VATAAFLGFMLGVIIAAVRARRGKPGT
jgi:hypothetical protein